MSYRHSNSLLNFKLRRKEVIDLLRTIKPSLITVHNGHLITPIVRASIVLLYSHIEGYIEDVVEEMFDFINNSGINVNSLPQAIRVAQCLPDIKEVSNITDPQKLDKTLKNIFLKNYPLWFGNTLPPVKIETNCLTKNFSNPSFEHVDKLFRNIGISKVFASFYDLGFKPKQIQPIRSTLDTLSSLRHDIAHGNLSTACSFLDLCRHMVVVSTFCEAIDARLGLYVESLTARFPWVN